jgi:hypothetical protein
MARDWRLVLGRKWLPLIDDLLKGVMTEQQIADKYGLTTRELAQFKSDEEMALRVRRLMAIIQDIADGMSYAQISEIHGISIEQIPHFANTWAKQIDFAREEGHRENRHLELMFEVGELRADIARELAQRSSNDDDLDDEDDDSDDD